MRRTWMLLLVIALLAIFMAVPAMAAEEDTTYCLCGASKTGSTRTGHASWCDGEDHDWQPLTDANVTADGYYYVPDGGLDLTAVRTIGTDDSNTHISVTLDLNGAALNAKSGQRALAVYYADFSITDSSTNDKNEGAGTLAGGGNSSNSSTIAFMSGVTEVNIYAGTVTVRSGISKYKDAGLFRVNSDSMKVNMYGGTLDGGKATQYGGNVYISAGEFNMYGGTITGGTITASTTAKYGGNILLAGGTFNMYNGTISNGQTTESGGRGGNIYLAKGSFKMYGGTITGGRTNESDGRGGNIYMAGGQFDMYGGTISCGLTDENAENANRGGAIYIGGGTFNMNKPDGTYSNKAGTIDGCRSTGNGGNLYISGAVVFNMYDGTIQNGKVTGDNGGGNIRMVKPSSGVDSDTVFNMTGGTISGGTTAFNDCGGIDMASGTFQMSGGMLTGADGGFYARGGVIKLSGSAKITGNADYNLYLQADVIATIGGDFTSDAKIGVRCRNAVDGTVFTDAASAANAANAKYFTSDDSNFVIVHDAAGLKLGTLATATGAVVNGTHVYALADAIAQAGATDRVALLSAIEGDVTVNKSVYLDLNGQTGNTGTLNVTGGTLYLMDSANASYVDNGANVNITVDGGEVARAFTTLSLKNAGNYDGNHRFLVIKTGGSYSAHRIYTAVKKNVLVPNKDGAVGITFRTELRCDETVAGLIGTNYGVKAYAYENENKIWESDNESYGEAVDAYGEAKNLNSKVALLGGVLRDPAEDDLYTNDQRVNWTWKGQAWFSFTDDIDTYTVTSAISSGKTLGQLIQAVNDQLATTEATPAQQTALGAMYTKWGGTMEGYGWDLTNIKKYAS